MIMHYVPHLWEVIPMRRVLFRAYLPHLWEVIPMRRVLCQCIHFSTFQYSFQVIAQPHLNFATGNFSKPNLRVAASVISMM